MSELPIQSDKTYVATTADANRAASFDGDARTVADVQGSGGTGALSVRALAGSGGMGEIFIAHSRTRGKWVALKRLRASLANEAAAIDRFRREGGLVRSLQHAHIAHIFESGTDEIGPYLIMEYVPGPHARRPDFAEDKWPSELPNPPWTLEDQVKLARPFSVDEARTMGEKLCGALTLAHAKGIIHRDIKPGNILLNQKWEPKIADFGIAVHQADATPRTTQVGSMMGTRGFVAPEQEVDAGTVDARADIYSLAATIWYALTGRDAETFRESDVPEPLRASLVAAMNYERSGRPKDAQEFADRLRAAATQAQTEASKHVQPRALPAAAATAFPPGTWFCKKPGCETPHARVDRYCSKCSTDNAELCPDPRCRHEGRHGNVFCTKCRIHIDNYRHVVVLKDRIDNHLASRRPVAASVLIKRALTVDTNDKALTSELRTRETQAKQIASTRVAAIGKVFELKLAFPIADHTRNAVQSLQNLIPAVDAKISAADQEENAALYLEKQFAGRASDAIRSHHTHLNSEYNRHKSAGNLKEWIAHAGALDAFPGSDTSLLQEAQQALAAAEKGFAAIRTLVSQLRNLKLVSEIDSATWYAALPRHSPDTPEFYKALCTRLSALATRYNGFAPVDEISKVRADVDEIAQRCEQHFTAFQSSIIKDGELANLHTLLPNSLPLQEARETRVAALRGSLLRNQSQHASSYLKLRDDRERRRDVHRAESWTITWTILLCVLFIPLSALAAGYIVGTIQIPKSDNKWLLFRAGENLLDLVFFFLGYMLPSIAAGMLGGYAPTAFMQQRSRIQTALINDPIAASCMIAMLCVLAASIAGRLFWPGYEWIGLATWVVFVAGIAAAGALVCKEFPHDAATVALPGVVLILLIWGILESFASQRVGFNWSAFTFTAIGGAIAALAVMSESSSQDGKIADKYGARPWWLSWR